ncbi:MAG: BatA domain-containing protein [Gemmataceae bacterium]
MSTFSFLTPLYLIGLAAAGIPLLIHLSRSRRTRKMRFSTTRFFTDQFLRSYRMSRLKELLLLACRMALFALLAMALARPFVLPKGSVTAGLGGGPRTVVLVLDDSASMGYVEDGAPLFRRAQEAARAVLATLAAGDTASVVLAGRRAGGPEVLFAEPTDDLDAVRTAIDRTPVSALATDLSGAITRAEEAAVSSRAAGRAVSIYILSDLQESGWEVPSRETIRADAADLAFVFVSVRPKAASRSIAASPPFARAARARESECRSRCGRCSPSPATTAATPPSACTSTAPRSASSGWSGCPAASGRRRGSTTPSRLPAGTADGSRSTTRCSRPTTGGSSPWRCRRRRERCRCWRSTARRRACRSWTSWPSSAPL